MSIPVNLRRPALGLIAGALAAATAHADTDAPRAPAATAAQAAPQPPAEGWSGSLSLGVANVPTYEGSPNRRALAVPGLSLAYRDKNLGTFALGSTGLSWVFAETTHYQLGVFVGGDGGRKARKTGGGGLVPASGDDRLAGMGDLEPTTELGALASAQVAGVPVEMTVHKAIGNRSHKGTQIDLQTSVPVEISDRLSASLGVGLTWSDAKYMQAHFGVTRAQAAASRFAAFEAKAGIRKVDLSVGFDYKMGADWSWAGGVTLSRLTGDAASSPISEKDMQVTTFTGIAYRF